MELICFVWFFAEKSQNCPAAGGFAPVHLPSAAEDSASNPPAVICLSGISLLNTQTFKFGSSPSANKILFARLFMCVIALQ